MAWFILSQLFSTLLTLLRLDRTSETDKDLETLILRQQQGRGAPVIAIDMVLNVLKPFGNHLFEIGRLKVEYECSANLVSDVSF